MSIRVMQWVWDHSEAKHTDRLVLLAIADCASDDGTKAWPSVATMAQKCRISIRATQTAVRHLIRGGLIAVEDQTGPRGTNRYTVVMTNICTPADIELPVSAPPQIPAQTPADIGQTPADLVSARPTSAPVTVHEPSIEPSDEPSAARVATTDVIGLAAKFCDAIPLSNLSKTRSVIAKALGSGYTPQQVSAGLEKLIEERRGCSEDTLRIALQPDRKQSTTNGRVMAALDLAAQYAAQEQQPRAIGR